jgi:hypothetical protein
MPTTVSRIALFALAVALTFAGTARVAGAMEGGGPADDPRSRILGNWLTADGSGIIRISVAADGSYEGRIVGGNQPGRRDARNPDASLRNR